MQFTNSQGRFFYPLHSMSSLEIDIFLSPNVHDGQYSFVLI